MSVVTNDLIKQLVKEQQFGSTREIMEAIKGMFQEAMEAELEAQIGHERY